jgi:serine/threonine-protein kinase
MSKIWQRYDRIQTINTGGTALVYIAVDKVSGFPVAIKELNNAYFQSEIMRKKFREEANRYLYLDHPNIVSLHDFHDYDDVQYLIMEYVDGVTISQYMKRMRSPMPYPMAASMMIQIAEALDFAHKSGYIHLDIKPSNVILKPDFNVVVIDFGIAHEALSGELGRPMGTPGYMSPEQIDGGEVGATSDIFSMGMMLYEMITGKLAFSWASSNEEIFEFTKTTVLPKVNPFYPQDNQNMDNMWRIIECATAKRASERYSDCTQFCNDLRGIANV